jgi:hypothetical protein
MASRAMRSEVFRLEEAQHDDSVIGDGQFHALLTLSELCWFSAFAIIAEASLKWHFASLLFTILRRSVNEIQSKLAADIMTGVGGKHWGAIFQKDCSELQQRNASPLRQLVSVEFGSHRAGILEQSTTLTFREASGSLNLTNCSDNEL